MLDAPGPPLSPAQGQPSTEVSSTGWPQVLSRQHRQQHTGQAERRTDEQRGRVVAVARWREPVEVLRPDPGREQACLLLGKLDTTAALAIILAPRRRRRRTCAAGSQRTQRSGRHGCGASTTAAGAQRQHR
eukprot:SAG25_NODE_897_length_4875_cov_2.036223_7_plen_131_part_00